MSLPKGLSYDENKDLYRLRLYHQGTKFLDKCFKSKGEALYYYPKALNIKEKYIKEFDEPQVLEINRVDNMGLIHMLRAA